MEKCCMYGNGGCVEWEMAGFAVCCVPMSSENPPTGRRQVPVTNWSRRILFSLSISFTTCRKSSPSFCCKGYSWCVRVGVTQCPYLPEPVNLLAVLGVVSINGVLLPICQINLLHPTEHQLQQTKQNFMCTLIMNRQKASRDRMMPSPIPTSN